MPPLYLTQRSHNTNRQDGLLKGAPSWGDELAEWWDFIHHLCQSGMATRFLRIWVEADPGFIEPPSDWRLRGFILKGYFPLVSSMTPTVMVGIVISPDCSQSLDNTEQSLSKKDG